MPTSASAFPQRRILVVDDQPDVCEAVKMMLDFDGHYVETATSAQEALARYEEGKYDLVITDWSMPFMKGDALAAALKERTPRLPVVMITAHAEILPRSIPGVDFIVPKPFLLENLREAIARVSKLYQATPTPAA